MAKAFDAAYPEGSLLKMGHPVTRALYSWPSSYRTDNPQVVSINGPLIQPQAITSGVIEGSVLHAYVILPLMNGVFQAVRRSLLFLFAEDIKLLNSF